MSTSMDWWTSIRTTAFFAAAEPVEPEPEPDAASVPLDSWAEVRTSKFGLGTHDTGDFIGVDQGGGDWPDWQHPVQPEQAEPTEMDEYAATRTARTASAVFGCPAPTPRSNTSPWAV